MKIQKMLFALLLVFSVMSGSAAAENSATMMEDGRVQITLEFADVNEAKWALQHIADMQSKKVLQGFPDGTFRPNQPISRVEAVVTAVRLMGLEEEAQSVSSATPLHFKDAEQIANKYPWATGYVVIALENGLFDFSEDKIQPDKPASRVWVSVLLVRALGLQDDALGEMTTVPAFKDAKEIPAGAVGYVNVAVEKGLVSGYPDGTFKPNKHVTRAEMAAFLDRTDDQLPGESDPSNEDGTKVVLPELPAIEDHLNGDDIREFKLELESSADGKLEIAYVRKADKTEAKIEQKANSREEKQSGDEAVSAVEQLLEDFALHPDMAQEEVAGRVLDVLNVDHFTTLKLELEFANGTEVEIEDQGDDQEEVEVPEAPAGIREFILEVESAGDKKLEVKYKRDEDKTEAKYESETNSGEEKVTGEAAVSKVEELLQTLDLGPDMGREELLEEVESALGLSEIEELKIKVIFANGQKVEVELEKEKDDKHDDDDDQDDDEENDEDDDDDKDDDED
ncbi:S-layer homology domain-containing protein [Brevibacillus humidisoli]|uniref:S-layer homology domain-containing protein n=1 Tax=Brevibacillus humidisoli TaxID=2895522 RepID=UPI001E648894|nr:S-layer homology domain-containing protein [Brevibacillus humidisoli]UFJ41152.1 S-layer homology domain-containing protein [Brevibacillus humidisoli]